VPQDPEEVRGWLSVSGLDLPERLFKIEAGLRELAARGSPPSREELEKWWEELEGAAGACERAVLGELEETCHALKEAAWALGTIQDALHNQRLTVPERMKALEHADQILDALEGRVRDVAGRPCRWGKQLGEARLRHTLLINDVAACVHVLAQHLLEKGPERVEGKCAIARGAEPEAVEVCKEWDWYTGALDEMGLYHVEDVGALKGFVVDGKVQLRVGSAEGHLAEIDVKKRVVRYYDTDEPVNRVMGKLIVRYAGGRCKRYDEEEGGGISKPSLVCEVKDPKKAAKALAFATSMDFRIGDRKREIIEKMERECIEEVLADHFGFSPEDVEKWRRERGKR